MAPADSIVAARWRLVPGFPDYRVSDRGGLQSRRGRNGARLPDGRWRDAKPFPDGHGYPGTYLTYRGVRRWFNIHQLVMIAFVGPPPDGQVVRHVDANDPNDNRLENLAYGTQAQNCADKWRHGTACLPRGPYRRRGTAMAPEPAVDPS